MSNPSVGCSSRRKQGEQERAHNNFSCIPVSGHGLFKSRCGRTGFAHHVISPLSYGAPCVKTIFPVIWVTDRFWGDESFSRRRPFVVTFLFRVDEYLRRQLFIQNFVIKAKKSWLEAATR